MLKTSKILRGVAIASLILLTSCADMTDTQQRMVSGGAAGAVVGTVGTVITGGCIPCGAAIGGAVGVGAGYVIDKVDGSNKPSQSSGSAPNSTYSPNPNYNAAPTPQN